MAGCTTGTSADVGTNNGSVWSRLPTTQVRIAAIASDGVSRPIVVVGGPTNGMTAQADYYGYCDAVRTALAPAGGKLIVTTLTGLNTTTKDAVNAYIKASVATNHADAVIDLTTDNRLYGSAYSTTYFPDGLHPNNTGHSFIADIGTPVLTAMMA